MDEQYTPEQQQADEQLLEQLEQYYLADQNVGCEFDR